MNDQWKRRPHLSKEKARQAGTPGWYSRGYLPHFSGDQVTQTVTFRLLDSMPQSVLDRWRGELKHLPERNRIVSDANALMLIWTKAMALAS